MTVQKHTAGDSSVYNFDPDLSDHPAPPHLSAIPEDEPQGIERFLIKFEQILDWIFRVLMIMAGLGLSFLMFGQIIMRYVIESPFAGIEEAAVLLGVWIYFLGMGYATRVREHIHGGIVTLIITDPYKINMIRFAGSIISMTAACIFGYFAFKYALFVIDKGRMSINLQWPRGLWSGSMIVGFSMMAGYFLLEAINEFRALRKSRQARCHQE
ncbi:MAG: TRAP transporter small permease [Pseudomonadales bacterium]|jgi:TRAP-type C4-dicarboxylate transport system permease small subunit